MKEKLEKLTELLKTDESLAKELFSITDAADAQKWISEHGIDMTLDEVKDFGAHMKKLLSARNEEGELSDEQLHQVAGGKSDMEKQYEEAVEKMHRAVNGFFEGVWDFLTGWW